MKKSQASSSNAAAKRRTGNGRKEHDCQCNSQHLQEKSNNGPVEQDWQAASSLEKKKVENMTANAEAAYSDAKDSQQQAVKYATEHPEDPVKNDKKYRTSKRSHIGQKKENLAFVKSSGALNVTAAEEDCQEGQRGAGRGKKNIWLSQTRERPRK